MSGPKSVRVRWLFLSTRLAALLLLLAAGTGPQLFADDAPAGPGDASVWASAAKSFLGTSTTGASRVYFTGANGIVTEVFYPTLDQVQNVDLQFLVMDATNTSTPADVEEKLQKSHSVTLQTNRALAWNATTTANNGAWKIKKTIFTDPSRNSLVQRVTFDVLQSGKFVKDFQLFLLNNPSINNSGGGGQFPGNDNSRTIQSGGRTFLCASEPNSTSSALACSAPWKVVDGATMVSHGFVGRNDGWTDLFAGSVDRKMDWHFDAAWNGNVAQMAWIDAGSGNVTSASFDVVLAFGQNETDAINAASGTLSSDLNAMLDTYVNGWLAYTGSLDNQNGLADDQYYLSAMTLKSIQDKSNGAMIAGPGSPWGETQRDSNAGGYHLIWARDLYKFASAMLTAGDVESARRAVEYLFNVQMQTVSGSDPFSRPGRFPQNSFVSGVPNWNATQMDETAMPLILAWKVYDHQASTGHGQFDLASMWPRLKMAAEFLAKDGPYTGQERWEEIGGLSPSTIAAEVAGLVCAAELAIAAGDPGAAAFYRATADKWRNNVANWTFTTKGFHGNQQYYIRANANEDPNDDASITLGNGAGTHGERYIIDGGFLELVRMGVMSPSDWTIEETLPEYDAILKQHIPGKGDLFFRYNYDGYGERNDGLDYDGQLGRGRLWPIFTAERGIYEVAKSKNGQSGTPYLQTLKAVSSPEGFIPEQVFNATTSVTGWSTVLPPGYQPGDATRSMRPLSWAMGEYINLISAINHGVHDAPSAVTKRYATDKPQVTVTFTVNASTEFGQEVVLIGNHPLLSEWIPPSGIKLSSANYPNWSVRVSLPANTPLEYKYVKIQKDRGPIWESGGNRSLTTPNSGGSSQTDSFR